MKRTPEAPPKRNDDPARVRGTLRRRSIALAGTLTIAALTIGGIVRAEEPKPQPTLATVPRVPTVTGQGPVTHVEGKITRSSRGRKGPVRILVERASGGPVTVLVAPDDVCDRLGLSLKTGDEVSVDGNMLKGERPILIATAFTVGGKQIRVRDADGKIIDPAGTVGSPSGDGAKPAIMGGGKPSPTTASSP
jgi:hypothetical protein